MLGPFLSPSLLFPPPNRFNDVVDDATGWTDRDEAEKALDCDAWRAQSTAAPADATESFIVVGKNYSGIASWEINTSSKQYNRWNVIKHGPCR